MSKKPESPSSELTIAFVFSHWEIQEADDTLQKLWETLIIQSFSPKLVQSAKKYWLLRESK